MAQPPHSLAEDFLFDIRLQARHIAAGLITQQQVDARFATLTDLQQDIDLLNVEQLVANATARRQRAKDLADR